MARTALPAHRQQLEEMATTWEQLADARRRQLKKQRKRDDDERQTKSAVVLAKAGTHTL
jgi:hypothetical protein